jgi:hypothetical protein
MRVLVNEPLYAATHSTVNWLLALCVLWIAALVAPGVAGEFRPRYNMAELIIFAPLTLLNALASFSPHFYCEARHMLTVLNFTGACMAAMFAGLAAVAWHQRPEGATMSCCSDLVHGLCCLGLAWSGAECVAIYGGQWGQIETARRFCATLGARKLAARAA